jgi:DNA-binding NtrC family response regulator
VLKGAQRGRELTISGDVIRIGKVEGNDLVLPDDTVSRVHCEILRDQKGYLLRDLHSTNGTFLDGAEIREAYIRAGSILTVGTVQLKFQPFEERIDILPSEKESLGEMVGASLRMREIYGLTERIAPTEATVLIEGETGTGKDLLARTIHDLSRRGPQPFVVVDCGAVAPNLIESELFGHEKGAFTGATTTRQGAFETAHGGTLFLDELGELSLDLQPKLLRVLEQREIRRVGGNRTIKVDIRIIAATKRELSKEVAKGKFREDLFFRLSVVPIRMPALRDRKEDLPLLVKSFLAKMNEPREIDQAAMQALMMHDWPGNIRELRNVLERGMYLSPGTSPVKLVALPGAAEPGDSTSISGPTFDPALSYRDNKEKWEFEFERRYLRWLMQRAEGNISRAAREADMDRKYLHKLLKKHAIVV